MNPNVILGLLALASKVDRPYVNITMAKDDVLDLLEIVQWAVANGWTPPTLAEELNELEVEQLEFDFDRCDDFEPGKPE